MSLTYGPALGPADSATGFCDAFHAIAGDGVTLQGGRLKLTINGFSVGLSSGYALASGRWVENDEPFTLTVPASGNNEDRTDALAVRVDHRARTAALEVLVDVDPAALRADMAPLRNDETYSILLYLIHVRRGATALTPDDVTDLREDSAFCGQVVPLSAVAGDVLYIYRFLTSGIDQEVARLIGLSEQVVTRADTAIDELDAAIQQAGGGSVVGELMTSRHPPSETGWFLCDGGAVPDGYPELSAILEGTLPNIPGGRYKTYIYGGTPAGG